VTELKTIKSIDLMSSQFGIAIQLNAFFNTLNAFQLLSRFMFQLHVKEVKNKTPL